MNDFSAVWECLEERGETFWVQRLSGSTHLIDCGDQLREYASKHGRPLYRCKIGRDRAWGFGMTAQEAIENALVIAENNKGVPRRA